MAKSQSSNESTPTDHDLLLRAVKLEIRSSIQRTAAEVDAAIFLQRRLNPQRLIPAAGGWAATYQTIAYVADLILSFEKPPTIVEFGSGTSSIWIGLALKSIGRGRLTTFDSDPLFAAKTRRLIAGHKLENFVDLQLAPLEPLPEGSLASTWYDLAIVEPSLKSIDLLVVDGPVGKSGELSRHSAYPLCAPSLNDGAIVLLDDIDRQSEKLTIEKWTADVTHGRLSHVETVSRTGVYSFHKN